MVLKRLMPHGIGYNSARRQHLRMVREYHTDLLASSDTCYDNLVVKVLDFEEGKELTNQSKHLDAMCSLKRISLPDLLIYFSNDEIKLKTRQFSPHISFRKVVTHDVNY